MEWIISFNSGDVGSDNSATCAQNYLYQPQDRHMKKKIKIES